MQSAAGCSEASLLEISYGLCILARGKLPLLLQARLKKQERHIDLAVPFAQFMMDNIPEEVPQDEKKVWAINMYAALRSYAAEPEFLAYLLLLRGRISDSVVRDNKRFCGEVLKIFLSLFDEGSRQITKQQFFYGLREVLPNKEKEVWQDLVSYFPAGTAEVQVNFEWLLFDDLYVLSPIVYALRLQHLEECVNLTERLEKLVEGCKDERRGTVSYGKVKEALENDTDFSLMHNEDRARAFGCHSNDLAEDTKQDMNTFLEIVKHCDIWHALYYPALANDDQGDGGDGE